MAGLSPQPRYSFAIVPGASLPSQSWWPELHAVINAAFLNKNHSVFPPTWTRLDPDPAKGAEGLSRELGDYGHMVIAFSASNSPVACTGWLPYRGENWLSKVDSRGISKVEAVPVSIDWEVCCFCVHPSARGQGLARQLLAEMVSDIKSRGGTRLFTHYAVDETGGFWTRLGFEVQPGAGGILAKGFKVDPDREGLRADIHFNMGMRTL
ncbi:hypothetical protein JX266_005115 [Neoarthrinium moseri]|nr:hypothetical protein JX266_005115 [Neoarthrinium moseri]